MKKLCFLCLATIFSFSLANAQRTNFGVKLGFNSSTVEVTDGADYDAKSGIHIGGLAHIHISDHFAVQPELVFSCLGGEVDDSKLKLNYINVPVLAQYMFSNGFRLQTGPQLGFLVSSELKFGDVEVDIDDAYNSIDFGWTLGAGYVFSSGIGIDARYNIGLSDITDASNSEAKNRVFQLGLFYQFKSNSGKKK
jgi:hypothetical protein